MADPVVLLVEDNEDDELLARMALQQSGAPHRLVVARDGEEALRYVHGGDESLTPAVILLDLKLPKLDGRAVLREIRGTPRTARVPVVVHTSSRLEENRLDAYVLGANAYYQKPMEFRAFAEGTSLLLAYWFCLNISAGGECPSVLAGYPCRVPEGGATATGTEGAGDVVVIDGHDDDRRATVAGLRSQSGTGRIAEIADGAQAEAFLRDLGGPPPDLAKAPRLALVDLHLPGAEACDVIQALRYRCDHHLLVVAFTRAATPERVQECYRLKVSSVVCKADGREAYRDVVRLLSHYWLRMNAPPPPPGTARRDTPRPG